MDESVIKFRVGVIVLFATFLAGILVLLFSELPIVRRTYTVYMLFNDAPGVTVDTPIRRSGILVGRVSEVEIKDDGSVVVTAAINSDAKIKRKLVPRISGSFLGDAVIQFVESDRRDENLVQDGETIAGSVAANPLQMLTNLEGNITQAINSVTVAGGEMGKLARNLNDLVSNNDEQINRIVMKTERSLDAFQQALGGFNNVMGDARMQANLRRGLSELPELVRETRTAMKRFQSTTVLAERNMRNLEGFTGPLGRRGESIVTRIDSTVGRLDELLAQFTTFGRTLNQRDSSLGQLVNNPELYQNLNAAACNIEQLTRELKPIVRDARAFSDKIARHPETLGIRGAIKPSSGIK